MHTFSPICCHLVQYFLLLCLVEIFPDVHIFFIFVRLVGNDEEKINHVSDRLQVYYKREGLASNPSYRVVNKQNKQSSLKY